MDNMRSDVRYYCVWQSEVLLTNKRKGPECYVIVEIGLSLNG